MSTRALKALYTSCRIHVHSHKHFSIFPKDAFAHRKEQPVIEPPALQLIGDLSNSHFTHCCDTESHVYAFRFGNTYDVVQIGGHREVRLTGVVVNTFRPISRPDGDTNPNSGGGKLANPQAPFTGEGFQGKLCCFSFQKAAFSPVNTEMETGAPLWSPFSKVTVFTPISCKQKAKTHQMETLPCKRGPSGNPSPGNWKGCVRKCEICVKSNMQIHPLRQPLGKKGAAECTVCTPEC